MFQYFSEDRDVDLLIWSHLVVACGVDWLVSQRYSIGWWNLAVFAAVWGGLSLLLFIRPLAYVVAMPLGIAAWSSLTAVLALAALCKLISEPSRSEMIVAALCGAPFGGWWAFQSYRTVLARRRRKSEERGG